MGKNWWHYRLLEGRRMHGYAYNFNQFTASAWGCDNYRSRGKLFLFKLYYEIDLARLKVGEDSLAMPLFWSNFWIQVHDLPMGLMSKMMAKQFGDFLGQILEYDTKSISKGYQSYMRIRACGRQSKIEYGRKKKPDLDGEENMDPHRDLVE
ncbi:hypothetical protein GOBAR_AA13727 [Gossypium barbadense]|uniref:Uncharacterized protein n=1 Tax=Gossypium barbadense TaxID=3634 RepID=A0A2P5XUE8_GOSBA|nr:hypothetical protein GOBAR_AA13727 [Gossypium barbadense]